MKYIALTIGPIYKTLQNSKKPKELWSASYLFSFIMRKIISEFKQREFITPFIEDASIFDESEIGLFHDRFIFKSHENDIYKLKSVVDDTLLFLAKELNMAKDIAEGYLQINYDEYDIDEGKNPILEITPYLDTAELFFQISQESDDEFINAIKDKNNFLLKGKDIVDDLKRLSFHKYYCVIHADGDNMSKVIENKEKIKQTSKQLFEYCKTSHKLIKEFGGQTIFAGGDDLLFFAPVVSKKSDKTIFELCADISQDFEKRFNGVATLSFGITINYIKFPLYEALENSREMLFAKAKQEPKNSIAFKVTKHSGQTFESIIYKGDKEVYDKFLAFISHLKSNENDNNFLHSMHHKLDSHKTTLNIIKTKKQKLRNFFENYFNKNEHTQYKDFFHTLTEYIYTSQDLDKVYATLRFIKFVKGDK